MGLMVVSRIATSGYRPGFCTSSEVISLQNRGMEVVVYIRKNRNLKNYLACKNLIVCSQ
jgi:hypothetical protein